MKFVTKSPVIPWDDGLAHRIRPTARFIAASLCSLDLRRLDIVEAIRGKPWNISEVFLTRSPVPKDLCQGVVSRSHPPRKPRHQLSFKGSVLLTAPTEDVILLTCGFINKYFLPVVLSLIGLIHPRRGEDTKFRTRCHIVWAMKPRWNWNAGIKELLLEP